MSVVQPFYRSATYDTLRTYYVGYGGNANTTTRFRRYDGTGARPGDELWVSGGTLGLGSSGAAGTGTITLGNRQASNFVPLSGVSPDHLADAAQLSSLSDETPEGRSIVVLAKQRFNVRERDIHALNARFVHFSAQTRMSGVDMNGTRLRKGAGDAIVGFVNGEGGQAPPQLVETSDRIAREGVTPAELERVKTQWVASKVYGRDSLHSQASELGSYWVQGFALDAEDRILAQLRTVTPPQVQAVAQRYFGDDQLTVATLLPQPLAAAAPRTPAASAATSPRH